MVKRIKNDIKNIIRIGKENNGVVEEEELVIKERIEGKNEEIDEEES